MKLILVFICGFGLLGVMGKSYAQMTKLSLSMKDVTVREVLQNIEEHSEFSFMFDNNKVDVTRKVSVSVSNESIEEILKQLFAENRVKFEVIDRHIILLPEEESNMAQSVIQPQNMVSGRVTDERENPLPGVTVVVKGKAQGTVTDVNGNYSLSNVQSDAMLVFSFVGMKTQEIAIQGNQVINIILREDYQALDEVIVIGYGTAKRKDYTGSVSSVKMENSPVALAPNLNALESLKGNVSGLNIGATNSAGGEPSMMIRGQNSISGSNDPLIVLDGVIYFGSINDINPNDIASFDILKDAVSAAAYGSRAANGIIAITTKRGNTTKPVITFNFSSGIQTWPDQPELMRGEKFIEVVNARNQYPAGSTNWLSMHPNWSAGKEIDWLDEVTRIGTLSDYQIAVSGANNGINYYMSTSYNKNKGVVYGDNFERISLLGKISTAITSWLKIGVDANYSRRDYSGFVANLLEAQCMSPYGALYRDDQGNLEKYPVTQSAINPLWGVSDDTRKNLDISQNFRLNANAIIDIPWIKGLTYRLNLHTNLDKNKSGDFYFEDYYVAEGVLLSRYEPATIQGFLSKANGNLANITTSSYVFDNILNYKSSFGKHSIEGTLVATRDYLKYEYNNMTGSDFASNGNTLLGMNGLHLATVQKVSMDGYERSNIGYLGRVSYAFKDRYYFTSSFRRDGASVFGINKKWGNFASAGIAWKVSEETFMKSFKALNSLKVKLSWGQNGNQGVGPFATLSKVSSGASGGSRYEFSNASGKVAYGLYQSTLGNSDLGWESTEALNTGFESSWLNSCITLDLDVYFSKTTDQIFTRNIPVMTGFKTITTSLGQVNNSGVELTLNTTNIKTKNLSWNTSLIFWKNNNKLVKLYGEDINGDGKEDDDISNSLFVGKSLGAIYGYKQDGIVQVSDTEYKTLTGAADGSPKYVDIDGLAGITAADRTILGYTKENFRLNLGNSLAYKNFEFYMLVIGVFGGNNLFLKSNTIAYMVAGTGRAGDNMTYKPYWTPERPSNVYPSATFAGDGRYLALQSRGFARIQDVSLSYTFKQSWLKHVNINSIKVYMAAKNIMTFTNWEGGDPETGAKFLDNTLPVVATYSIGANISF